MDPDACLTEMLALAARILASPEAHDERAEALAERVVALDEWLARKGHLPARWKQEPF